jgi:hypothetical protein
VDGNVSENDMRRMKNDILNGNFSVFPKTYPLPLGPRLAPYLNLARTGRWTAAKSVEDNWKEHRYFYEHRFGKFLELLKKYRKK